MARRAFVASAAGFRAIANGPEMRKALQEVAEKGTAHAESISQDFRSDDERPEHKHYADSFEVRDATIQWTGEYPGPRAAAELANTSDHAMAVEYGYKGRSGEPSTSAHRVLGKTLEFLEGEARA